jgi:hypothetical protein
MDKKFQSLIEYVEHKLLVKAIVVFQATWKEKRVQGTITVGVYERNVSPQNHSQDTTLNDHYVYQFIYFGEFIFSFHTNILCD